MQKVHSSLVGHDSRLWPRLSDNTHKFPHLLGQFSRTTNFYPFSGFTLCKIVECCACGWSRAPPSAIPTPGGRRGEVACIRAIQDSLQWQFDTVTELTVPLTLPSHADDQNICLTRPCAGIHFTFLILHWPDVMRSSANIYVNEAMVRTCNIFQFNNLKCYYINKLGLKFFFFFNHQPLFNILSSRQRSNESLFSLSPRLINYICIVIANRFTTLMTALDFSFFHISTLK